MKSILLLLCGACALQPVFAQSKATVHEVSVAKKTYPFSDPDPVGNPENMYYPYFRFDGFAANGENHNWKTVLMENDYIKVRLFPEIGGKVWEAIDKTTNRDFVYNNSVVKFRDIAMRGAWVSGGIEWNFGIMGHAPTSSTPIDYYTRENEDGSVSCFISSYELVTRTVWNVEVNLPKDKAYFTTTTTWYNHSAIHQPYYQWMNGGFKASNEVQFFFPGDHYLTHAGEAFNFPIDEKGRDLSWYKNNNFGEYKSDHIFGNYNDFYGIYWHDEDFGSVHYANYNDKLGQKIFLWSQSREGSIWEDLLTDTDGQYIEMQSGRMFNQPASFSAYTPFKHNGFAPQQTDRFTEYWFPVKGTKGISKVSPIGALHVAREGNDLVLHFSPLEKLNTTVKLFNEGKEVSSIALKADVLKTWTERIPNLGSIERGKLKIIIGDNELIYTEDSNETNQNRPTELPTDFNWDSAYGLFVQGEQHFNQKLNEKAEEYLKQSLAKEPYFAPALNCLASLYVSEGRFEEAIKLLRKSLSTNTYDAEANYLYGLCHQQWGHSADAKDGFSVATYSNEYRSAAYAKLGELYLKEHNYEKAEHFALRSLESNVMNLDARQILMVVYRYMGQIEKADEQIKLVLKDLPLYHFARYEHALLHENDQLTHFKSLIRNELPAETYMELAGWYEKVGCHEEAIELFGCADNYPISLYRKGYILHQLGKESEAKACVEKATAAPVDFVFPFRAETLNALTWASSVTKSWKINYYSALVCWANKRYEEASKFMNSSEEADNALFYLCRAKFQKTTNKGQHQLCINDLLKAQKIADSWRVGFALIKEYLALNDWQNAVKIGERYMKKDRDNYYIGLKLAKGYCGAGRYDDCIKLLKGLLVLPNEGSSAGREVYREANIHNAMDYLKKGNYSKAQRSLDASLMWPENLGVGKPYDNLIDSRLEQYIQSRINLGLNKQAETSILLQKIATNQMDTTHFRSCNLLSACALRETGKVKEADAMAEKWMQDYPNETIAKWCYYIYKGQIEEAKQVLVKNEKQDDLTPSWEFTFRDVDLDLVVRMAEKGLIK